MSENITPPAPTEGQHDPAQQTPDVNALQAEIDKWKSLSRKNEDRFKSTSTELETLRQSQLRDSEKAIEAAKAEGRASALSEYGVRLAEAELRTQAAAAGVALPAAEFLALNAFLGADGSVNADAVKAFVTSFAKTGPTYNQNIGLGRQGSPGTNQLSRAELSNMSPSEIQAARKAGRLDSLLRGEI